MQFFLPLLTILFIYLKLIGSVAWSWWWVFSPLWVGWIVTLTLFLVAYIISKKHFG